MKRLFLILAAVSLVAISCNKEELNNVSKTRPVTLNLGIGAETKVSHSYSENKVKPAWEDTDYVYIQFEKNGTEYLEKFDIDASSISGDGKSASFSNSASKLADDVDYKVIYATPDYMTESGNPLSFNLGTQSGSIEELPEYLEAEVPAGETSAALVSKLTYFHFVLTLPNPTKYESIKEDIGFGAWDNNAFAEGYLGLYETDNTTAELKIDKSNVTLGGTIEMYAAAFKVAQATSYNVKIKLTQKAGGFPSFPSHGGEGDADANSVDMHYSWNASKDYAAGKVYKVVGTLVK